MSRRFLVAEARARFGELLDEADQGTTVIIERHGVEYTLKASPRPRRPRAPRYVEWTDPAVLSGQWTWTSGQGGLQFKPRRSRKRR